MFLMNGSADQRLDGVVASSIGYIFVEHPRPCAVPALIESMNKYELKKRFIDALGNTATEEAIEALLTFLRKCVEQPDDLALLQSLAKALKKSAPKRAEPLFQVLIEKSRYSEEVKRVAQQSLQILSQSESYDIEQIRNALVVTDKEGRRSDWLYIQEVANWLRDNGLQNEIIREHQLEIITLLETVLISHEIDYTRKAVAFALGEIGNAQTFVHLISHLEKKEEPSLQNVSVMLSSLHRLTERGQIDPLFEKRITKCFKDIQNAYPLLRFEIKDVENYVHQYFKSHAC